MSRSTAARGPNCDTVPSVSTSSLSIVASSAGRCVTSSTVVPAARSEASRASTSASPAPSRNALGSSNTSRPGRLYNARASATRCRCPVESRPPAIRVA